ncbi:MBL fold metallo-hydrolase [Mesobacillus selenatarsenatis]|uniref:MBL fold metallo-hydrolase n=1 Tax=Mesobacillus selenatarsenatis TaxID=388741 RepID=A0A846TX21_9BACI|nr:MBL fold metallo-hydrolase [Mesobacillus selenatarsenatis]NKE06881.1 MBL fold metallo-hydrolase [Mesobacillus selenatarsenatis]
MAVYAVLNYYPTFGGKHTDKRKSLYAKSLQYRNGRFVNQAETSWNTSFSSMISMMKDFVKGNPERRPKVPLQMAAYKPGAKEDSAAKVTWFGHSAFLLEIEGKTILFDPMFGKAPTPFPVRNQRYSRELPFKIEELPVIDAVVLSHDHYDHLDYGSIMKLKNKVKNFIAPLGVGAHLQRWGIAPEIIQEHDWWDELPFEGLELVCAPARHFSGRSLTDRNATLWCSWVIKGQDIKIFYSGDGGYGPHFKEIGEKYGPFDLTLMECGQYDARWAALHMMPEETVQAHQDVRGRLMIPVHWGAFTLSLHAWHDPVERAVRSAKEAGVQIATPRIGETFVVGLDDYPASAWWHRIEMTEQN